MSRIGNEGLTEGLTQISAWMLRFAMGLILCALCVAAYLLWLSQGGGIGCGAKFGCGAVLQSSWSMWRGIPVAALALAAYIGMAAGTCTLCFGNFPRWSRFNEAMVCYLAVVVMLSSLWFFLVQVFSLKQFCPWCMTVHLCGSAGAVILLWLRPWKGPPAPPKKNPATRVYWVMGICTVAVMVFGQIAERSTSRNQRIVPGAMTFSVTPEGKRNLVFSRSMLVVSVAEDPVLGNQQAQRLAILFFDFTCPQCRQMHIQLVELLPRYQKHVAIVCLPVPLESSCNHLVRVNRRLHLHACEYARLAIAVWRTDTKAYAEFDRTMFATELPPSLEYARERAQMLVGGDRLAQALMDKRVNELIARNVAIYHDTFYLTGIDALPQLHMENRIMFGLADKQEDVLGFLGITQTSAQDRPVK